MRNSNDKPHHPQTTRKPYLTLGGKTHYQNFFASSLAPLSVWDCAHSLLFFVQMTHDMSGLHWGWSTLFNHVMHLLCYHKGFGFLQSLFVCLYAILGWHESCQDASSAALSPILWIRNAISESDCCQEKDALCWFLVTQSWSWTTEEIVTKYNAKLSFQLKLFMFFHCIPPTIADKQSPVPVVQSVTADILEPGVMKLIYWSVTDMANKHSPRWPPQHWILCSSVQWNPLFCIVKGRCCCRRFRSQREALWCLSCCGLHAWVWI